MNDQMLTGFLWVVVVVTIFIIFVRMKKSNNNAYRSGFLLNPLLYLVFFCLFYLIFGSLGILYGSYYFFDLGSYRTDLGTTVESTYKSIIFYLIIISFYIFSKDRKIGAISINLGFNTYCLIFSFSILISFYLFYIIAVHFSDIYLLRSGRVGAYYYYVENIWNGLKYSFFLNISTALVFLSFLSRRKSVLLSSLAFLIVFLVLLIDYSHGGRSASIRIIMAGYLAFAINSNRYFVKEIFLTMLILGLLGVLQRSVGQVLSLESLHLLLAEFTLTRYVTDIVLYHDLRGEYIMPFLSFFTSFLPGAIRDVLGVSSSSIGGFIQDFTGLSFGLAGNIVAESIFYFGDFYFISAIIISLFYYLLSRIRISNIFFLLLVMLYIIGTQNMIRTSFYDFGLSIFYLLATQLFVFSFLFSKKKLISK
jgi:hypothetical protein